MDAPRIGQLIKKLTTQKTQNIKKSSISSILSIIIIIIIIIIIMIIIYGICKTFLEMKTYNILPIRESPSHPLSNFQHL